MKKLEYKNTFAFAKKKIEISKNLFVEKGDVGIIESETAKGSLIFSSELGQK